jgi:hypothetical protein
MRLAMFLPTLLRLLRNVSSLDWRLRPMSRRRGLRADDAFNNGLNVDVHDCALGTVCRNERESREKGTDKCPELASVSRDEQPLRNVNEVFVTGDDSFCGCAGIGLALRSLKLYQEPLNSFLGPRRNDVQRFVDELVQAVGDRAGAAAVRTGARLVADHHSGTPADAEPGRKDGSAVVADRGRRRPAIPRARTRA